jgi:hypothetical protein
MVADTLLFGLLSCLAQECAVVFVVSLAGSLVSVKEAHFGSAVCGFQETAEPAVSVSDITWLYSQVEPPFAQLGMILI